MEEMKKPGETTSSSSPTSAQSNQSVTSPIFNSMAVVSTSTPSSSDKENSTTPTQTVIDLNHTTNSIKKSEMAASNMMMMSSSNNKIELNIQNSRPLMSRDPNSRNVSQQSGNGTTTTLVNGSTGSSGASTLKLFIKKQDFSVQVGDRAGQYTVGANRGGPRFTQSPNGNTFGRSKKSIDLVASEESKGIFHYH